MKSYLVTLRNERFLTYKVEANSKEEAEKKAQWDVPRWGPMPEGVREYQEAADDDYIVDPDLTEEFDGDEEDDDE
jgi:hypothetical protein